MQKIIFLLFLMLVSCAKENKSSSNNIDVDLNDQVANIPYSIFTDSLERVVLKTENSVCTGVKRLYIDGDYIFILDSGKEGILVFSKSRQEQIAQINYYGAGPEEFRSISAFALDKTRKRIIIYSNPDIVEYTYSGEFIKRQVIDMHFYDFFSLSDGDFICILSNYYEHQPCGVWTVDSVFQKKKDLKTDIPKTEIFTSLSRFYNPLNDAIYYYDRVWDDLSYISKDTVQIINTIDLKQRVPAEDRGEPSPKSLPNSVAIASFANSKDYLLMSYYPFKNEPWYWVLYDRKVNRVYISRSLYNDIEDLKISARGLFYVNDSTWCIVPEFTENTSDILLEFVRLKE